MLENIYVNHYKCFEEFEASGFKRVNLVVGDNNVGKSTLLELIRIAYTEGDFVSFGNIIQKIFTERNLTLDDIKYYFDNFSSLKIVTNKIEFELMVINYDDLTSKEKENLDKEYKSKLALYMQKFLTVQITKENILKREKKYTYNLNMFLDNFYKQILVNKDYIKFPEKTTNFINTTAPKNKEIVKLYSYIQKNLLQKKFLEYVRKFDNSIEFIEPMISDYDDISILIQSKYNDHPLKISEYGEGLARYMEIIFSIIKAKNGILLIDEIENGIHYSKQQKFWDTIIEVAEAENVQIFATTHSREMIENFVEVCNTKEYKDVSLISLFRNKENKIKALNIGYDKLQYNINIGHELR